MGSDINKRMADLISLMGMNANSFADFMGVAPTVIYNIVGGRKSKPSFELLEKIIAKVDNVNISWLIKGTGEPFGAAGYIKPKSIEERIQDLEIQMKQVLNRSKPNDVDEADRVADEVARRSLKPRTKAS